MADPDEREVPTLLLASHSIGEPKIRVPHDAEDMGDTPIDHRLHHDI